MPVVPNAIDRGVFGAAGTKRPGSIAYMPRKYSNAVGWLRDNVPEAAAWNWLPLHNLSQTEVASELGQAEVFVLVWILKPLKPEPTNSLFQEAWGSRATSPKYTSACAAALSQ